MEKNFKQLSSEYLVRHPYFTARRDSYETPSGKIVEPYFVVEIPESACAVAVTEENAIILIEQFRYPIGKECIELPGGFMDEGEEPSKAIVRELSEETGYSFRDFVYLGKTWSNPGVLNKPTHLFLATGGRKTGKQELDPNEEIKIILRSKAEVRTMLSEGAFRQSLHETCLHRAFARLSGDKNS